MPFCKVSGRISSSGSVCPQPMKVNGVPMGGVWLVSLGKMNSGVRLKRFSSGSDIKAMSFLKVLE